MSKKRTRDRALVLRAIEIINTSPGIVGESEALLKAAVEKFGGNRDAALLYIVDIAASSITTLYRQHINDSDNWKQGQLPLGICLPGQVEVDEQRYIKTDQATGAEVLTFAKDVARREAAKAFKSSSTVATIEAVRDVAIEQGIDWESANFVQVLDQVKADVRPVLRDQKRREIE